MENKKKILLLLKGCPGTGKSTWAKSFVEDNPDYVIVNRDTIRYEIGGGTYTMEHEKEVTEKENGLIDNAIKEGKNLIIDATNLNTKYLGRWEDLSKEHGYEIKWKEFYVPFEEAKRRIAQRVKDGGLDIPHDVLVRFYSTYYPEEYAKYREEKKAKKNQLKTVEHFRLEKDSTLPPCVICDIDGTIAWMQGRNAYNTKLVKEDKVDKRVAALMSFFMGNGVQVVFLSGREDIGDCRKDTLEWLDKYLENKETNKLSGSHLNYELHMRKRGDHRGDEIVKRELFDEFIKGQYDVMAVYDDRNKVVNMWRELGLMCCQVADGDF